MRSPCSVCVRARPRVRVSVVARQRLGKHVPAGMNIHARIEQRLNFVFCM
jgi:hypothetical protein